MSRQRKGRSKVWIIACDAEGCKATIAEVQGSEWVEVHFPDWPEGGPNRFVEFFHFCSSAHFVAFYEARMQEFADIEAQVAWDEEHPEPEPGTDPDWDRLVASPAYQQP